MIEIIILSEKWIIIRVYVANFNEIFRNLICCSLASVYSYSNFVVEICSETLEFNAYQVESNLSES
jgi:hypothetical protein